MKLNTKIGEVTIAVPHCLGLFAGPSANVKSSDDLCFTMKIASLVALFGSAAAFAPVQQAKTSTSSLAAWKDDVVVGITAPVGFFDPLGLSVGQSDVTMGYYREAELKHGRIAMSACLGWFITAGGTHPLFNLSDDPVKAATELPITGWLQIIMACSAVEWLTEQIKKRPGYVPGDLLGASYWVDNSDEGWVDYQNKELNNGRLAMLAFMGIYTQDVLFGNFGDLIFKR